MQNLKLMILLLLPAALLTLVSFPALPEEGSPQFMGPSFAGMICEEWNKSTLPKRLGTEESGGNGWISEENKYTGEKKGVQTIVMSRRDCRSIPRTQLTIENKEGKAVCTYGGARKVDYEKSSWAFAPETVQWYQFGTGDWGYLQMPGIMDGFRGPMFVARANIDNFGLFWIFTARLAKRVNADYGKDCPTMDSDDKEDIREYLAEIP